MMAIWIVYVDIITANLIVFHTAMPKISSCVRHRSILLQFVRVQETTDLAGDHRGAGDGAGGAGDVVGLEDGGVQGAVKQVVSHCKSDERCVH